MEAFLLSASPYALSANDGTLRSNLASLSLSSGERDKTSRLMDVGEQEMDSVAAVDLAIRLMDRKYGTQFYNWIKSEDNVDYIAYHCKRIVFEYDEKLAARAFQWLFQNWSMSNIAGLLIKMFYERGLDDSRFANVVSEILLGRSWEDVVDLIATLIIGEDVHVTTRFLHMVTTTWEATLIVDLVHAIAVRSRWQAGFYENIVMEFASLHAVGIRDANSRIQEIQRFFEEHSALFPSKTLLVGDDALNLPTRAGINLMVTQHRAAARRMLEVALMDRPEPIVVREPPFTQIRQGTDTLPNDQSTLSSPLDLSSCPMSPSKDPRSPRSPRSD